MHSLRGRHVPDGAGRHAGRIVHGLRGRLVSVERGLQRLPCLWEWCLPVRSGCYMGRSVHDLRGRMVSVERGRQCLHRLRERHLPDRSGRHWLQADSRLARACKRPTDPPWQRFVFPRHPHTPPVRQLPGLLSHHNPTPLEQVSPPTERATFGVGEGRYGNQRSHWPRTISLTGPYPH